MKRSSTRSRHGEALRLLDPQRVWLGSDREWWAHDQRSVVRYAPPLAGIYMVRSGTPIYVGETDNLRDRLLYHLQETWSSEEAAQGPLEFWLRSTRVG